MIVARIDVYVDLRVQLSEVGDDGRCLVGCEGVHAGQPDTPAQPMILT